MLEKLGIYGMGAIEAPLLGGLASGEPILLVGGHGSAKTTLCRRIAEVLGMRFHAYDASKALFEDMIGFPDPSRMAEGKMGYIPTPMSIWDKEFVLIDELSRATPSMQNKWLEVIRSRSVMGVELPQIKQVVAAMNPVSYLGAHQLDEALAGRFALIIKVPEASDMQREELIRVIGNLTEEDGFMGKRAGVPQAAGSGLAGLVARTRELMEGLDQGFLDSAVEYAAGLHRFFSESGTAIDGRRLGMISRMVAAGACAKAALEGRGSLRFFDIDKDLGGWVGSFLASEAREQPISRFTLAMAHRRAFAEAMGRGQGGPSFPRSAIKCAGLVRETAAEERPEITRERVSRIVHRSVKGRSRQECSEGIAAAALLSRDICSGKLRLEPDETRRLMDCYRRSFAMETSGMVEGFANFLAWFQAERGESDWRAPERFRMLVVGFVLEDCDDPDPATVAGHIDNLEEAFKEAGLDGEEESVPRAGGAR